MSSGRRRTTSASKAPDSGSRSRVHRMLNREWAAAMPTGAAGAPRSGGRSRALTAQNTVSHTAEPATLKDRWTSAARLAFLLAPTADRMVVTQVPMFCPMMMGMAAA